MQSRTQPEWRGWSRPPGLIAIALASAVGAPLRAQEPTGRVHSLTLQRRGQEDALYHLFIPAGIAKGKLYPLVYALHDRGHTAAEHLRRLIPLATPERPVFLVAPQYQRGVRPSDPVRADLGIILRAVLTEVLANQPIDPSRIVLEGTAAGASFASAWSSYWFARDPATFPFCSLWIVGAAVAPRRPFPKIPFLLFGVRSPGARAKSSPRPRAMGQTYRRLFDMDLDVRYHEIAARAARPEKGFLEVMRAFLDSLPDWGAARLRLPGESTSFDPIDQRCLKGDLRGALAALEARTENASPDDGHTCEQARAYRRHIESFLATWAERTSASLVRHPDLAIYDRLVAQAAIFSNHPTLGPRLAAAIERVHKCASMQREIRAQAEFLQARARVGASAQVHRRLFAAIANGPLADTEYGRRAHQHLLALGALD